MKHEYRNNIIGLVLALVIIGAIFIVYHKKNPQVIHQDPPKETAQDPIPVSITSREIKEDNFTGKVAVITGSSSTAQAARTYIENETADFKAQADRDVPAMREEFGADSPTANYTIQIDADYKKDTKTESVILSIYEYTGGAHGNSAYKVITSDLASDTILGLSDIIKEDEQKAFAEFVKKELINWRPEGSGAPVVFPEVVKDLNFDSFRNWSFENGKLVVYFSQYEIGPGALGSVPFPLPIQKVRSFLVEKYI